MDEEYFEVPEAAAAELEAARGGGGRIVAVGTTVVRAIESACDANGGMLAAARGWTRKYILPPYRFQAVDGLITNDPVAALAVRRERQGLAAWERVILGFRRRLEGR